MKEPAAYLGPPYLPPPTLRSLDRAMSFSQLTPAPVAELLLDLAKAQG